MMNWRDYWNHDTSIYANEQHKFVHYQLVANDIISLIPSHETVVLDYGCGEALQADQIAATCQLLYLCDAAPFVQERLRQRFHSHNRIKILASEDLLNIPGASLDLIIVNSVIQYFSTEDLSNLLKIWRSKLSATGQLVIADVIPPDLNPLVDAKALLIFAWKGGFFTSAVLSLVRTAFSDYRKIRQRFGLSQYSEHEIVEALRHAGFQAYRSERNLGHNQARMTFVAKHI